jgi:hypothetical protein
MRQASLVAFYGPKPGPLEDFLRSCQDKVHKSIRQLDVRASFRPYSLTQIHATLVGLERRDPSGGNRSFDVFRGVSKVMRLPELFTSLTNSEDLPRCVQFGGFEDRDYPFRSRGARPYDRSFSLPGTIAVIMGWPFGPGCRGDDHREDPRAYPDTLDDVRRSAQRFNVLHRWHRGPADVDNDLYLRLGEVPGDLQQSDRQAIENAIRKGLSAAPPLRVRLEVSDLSVVSYPTDDETLPETRSRVFRLTDPRLRDEDFIGQLYG